MGTEDATVTANFAAKNFWAVTYDYNDGVTANEEVRVLKTEADTYTLKAAPSRENFRFSGWKIDAITYTAGAAYEPTADVTARAQWEFNGTLITYNKSNKSDLATGANYILIGEKTGEYQFAEPSELGDKHKFFDSSAKGEYSSISDTKAELFDENRLIITLEETAEGWYLKDGSGRKLGMSGDRQISWNSGDMTWELGGTDEEPCFAATYNDKVYTMYYNSSYTRFNAYTSKGSNVNAYFYRLADGKSVYTLTLDFNDGVAADETHRVLQGADYTLATPERTGYAFTGWNTEEDGTGTSYPAGAYAMPAANTTLYAQWSSTESVTVTSAGYATYVSDYDLNYTGLGVKAYKASLAETTITFTKVTTVPAGQGVLLQGTGTFDVPVTTGVADWNDNAFIRGTGANVATESDGKYNYILNNGSNGVGFYKANGQKVAKNRAYLQSTSNAARLSFSFDDEAGEATGISEVKDVKADAAIYNLNGVRVKNMTKGLYIMNGKKVVLK